MNFPIKYIRWIKNVTKQEIVNMCKDINENLKFLLDNINYKDKLLIPKIINDNYIISEPGIYLLDTNNEFTIELPENPENGFSINFCDYTIGNKEIIIKSNKPIYDENELKIDLSNFNFTLLYYDKWIIG